MALDAKQSHANNDYRLRRQHAGYGPRRDEPRWVQVAPPGSDPNRPLAGSDLQRTVDEMQLALTLTSLKESKSDGVDHLVTALLVSLGNPLPCTCY